MTNFFRILSITICSVFYPLIVTLYDLFYDLASTRLLTTDQIQSFSRNIYVLISVVMLFAFAIKAIESIINPDLLLDSKKGFSSIIKRAIIAMALIVIIPFAFNYFYKFQSQVLEKNLIEKVLVGMQIDSGANVSKTSKAGQVLASTAISTVLYPSSDEVETSSESLAKNYNKMVEKDISKIDKVADGINEKSGDDEYVLHFDWFIAIIFGGGLVYLFFLFCIDTATRLVKMAFLELTAPVSIMIYIYSGDDSLKKWFKEVTGTALSVFVRIAALSLVIYMMSLLPDFIDNTFKNSDHSGLAKILIIMGLLIFVKEAPKLIEKMFGISIPSKGGIKGRLGSMAGVGGLAQKLWSGAKGLLPAAAIAGAGLAGAGIGGIASKLGNKFGMSNKAQEIKDKFNGTKVGQLTQKAGSGISKLGNAVSPHLKNAGNIMKSGVKAGGVIKGTQEAIKAANNSGARQMAKMQRQSINDKAKHDKLFEDIGIDPEYNTVSDVKSAISNHQNSMDKASINTTAKTNLKNLTAANSRKALTNQMKTSADNISTKLLGARDNATSPALKQKLENLDNSFKSGSISTKDFINELKNLSSNGYISESTAKSIAGDVDTILNTAAATGLTSSVLDGDNIKVSQIASANKAVERSAESAKKLYDASYEKSSDFEKQQMDMYMESAGIIDSANAKSVKKGNSTYKSESGYANPSLMSGNNDQGSSNSNNPLPNANTNSNSSQTSNSNTNSVTPSGYTRTENGVFVPNDDFFESRVQDRSNESNYESSIPTTSDQKNDRIRRNEDRMRELNNKPHMTDDDRREFNELQRENESLYREITDLGGSNE